MAWMKPRILYAAMLFCALMKRQRLDVHSPKGVTALTSATNALAFVIRKSGKIPVARNPHRSSPGESTAKELKLRRLPGFEVDRQDVEADLIGNSRQCLKVLTRHPA